MIEVGAMVDAGLLARSSTEDLWLPGVKMRIKVYDGNWTVGTIHAAQQWEGNGVVTPQSDHTR